MDNTDNTFTEIRPRKSWRKVLRTLSGTSTVAARVDTHDKYGEHLIFFSNGNIINISTFCIFKALIWEVRTVLGIVMVRKVSFRLFTLTKSWESLHEKIRSLICFTALHSMLSAVCCLLSQVVKPLKPTAMPSSPCCSQRRAVLTLSGFSPWQRLNVISGHRILQGFGVQEDRQRRKTNKGVNQRWKNDNGVTTEWQRRKDVWKKRCFKRWKKWKERCWTRKEIGEFEQLEPFCEHRHFSYLSDFET